MVQLVVVGLGSCSPLRPHPKRKASHPRPNVFIIQLTAPQTYAPSLIKDKFIVQPVSTEEKNDPAKVELVDSRVIKRLIENT